MLNAQLDAIKAITPGIEYRNVHKLACEVLVSGLKDIGLMKGDPQEAVEAGAHAIFFQCGLGHMMGLDVHDMNALGEEYVGYTETVKKSSQFGLCSLRLGKSLEASFVITVEPGLYFIPALIDHWKDKKLHESFINYKKLESYRDFGGVRLEDTVLVTENGCRLLGKPIPKAMDEIEALVSE